MDFRNMFDARYGLAKSVPRQSMKDVVAGKIATLIASGVLGVGDALPGERELAAALAVSRETVRGAIFILSTRGILSVTQGARTVVADSEVGELAVQSARYRDIAAYSLDDVHAARLLVEPPLARAAALAVTPAVLEELRISLLAQEAAVSDPVRFLICDREFHLAVYRAAGNAVLADMAADLYSYLLAHRRRAVSRPGGIATSIADHRAILAGLEAHDPEATASAFVIHETRIYTTTRQLFPSAVASREE